MSLRLMHAMSMEDFVRELLDYIAVLEGENEQLRSDLARNEAAFRLLAHAS